LYCRFERFPLGFGSRPAGVKYDFKSHGQQRPIPPDGLAQTALHAIAVDRISHRARNGQPDAACFLAARLAAKSREKDVRPPDAFFIDPLKFRALAKAFGFGEAFRFLGCRTIGLIVPS
jgi:hypothetical protein